MSVMRSWQTLDPSPILIVDFAVSSLANVHARCDEMELSSETLTIFFGRVYDGNGQVTIPLDHSIFNLVKPSDKPLPLRSPEDENILCWLEIQTHQNNGCVITAYKHGFITVAGVGPLDVVYKGQDS
jgi:hypothetical protein